MIRNKRILVPSPANCLSFQIWMLLHANSAGCRARWREKVHDNDNVLTAVAVRALIFLDENFCVCMDGFELVSSPNQRLLGALHSLVQLFEQIHS